jgi:hypothetical protein
MSRRSILQYITALLQNSENSSNSNSSSYNSKSENANEKVIKKVNKLLETDNPVPIIEKLKSISYINKILASMKDDWLLAKKENKEIVVHELTKRLSEIKKQMIEEERQEEIARYIEELKELKTKLKRLEKKLEKLYAKNPIYNATIMEENSQTTRAKLEEIDNILANPLDVKYLEVAIYNINLHINFQERLIKGLKEQVCSRILTPKQVGPICWFMATFVAMFYSQRNRKVLLKASNGWNKQDALFTLLKHVLDDKYLMSENEQEDYEKFSDNTFGNILTLLFEKDAKSFPYNPKFKVGFRSEVYICKLYNLLGVDCEMFDYIGGALLTYSYLNKEYYVMDYIFDINDETKYREVKKEYKESKKGYVIDLKDTYYTKNKSTPTILIIRVCMDYIILGNRIPDDGMYNELTSLREEIKYNDKTYILDSVILSDDKSCHSIAGITCKGIKYIYNGWTRKSMDPAMANQEITRNIPCGLQQHDWNVKDGDGFCLNTITCMPDIFKQRKPDETRLCFNFSKGDRILIYVLKDKHLEKLNKAA